VDIGSEITWIGVRLIISKRYTFIFFLNYIYKREDVIWSVLFTLSIYPWVFMWVLCIFTKLYFLSNIGVMVPTFRAFLTFIRSTKANAWEHAFLVQAFRSNKILNIESYSCSRRYILRNGIEIIPMHMTTGWRIGLQIQIIFILNSYIFHTFQSLLWTGRSHRHVDRFLQVATFKPRIEKQLPLLFYILWYDQVSGIIV